MINNKKFLLFLLFNTLIFSSKIKLNKKALSNNKKDNVINFNVVEVNFESLCHNLDKGFHFAVIVDKNEDYSAVFPNKFNLVSEDEGELEINTFCTMYAGETEIMCTTTDDKPSAYKGPFRVKKTSGFDFTCNVGDTTTEVKCHLNSMDIKDTVSVSKLYSTYNLETPDQTIDYTKSSNPSFYLEFDYIDEQSDTKVFYYDEDDRENYEITTCDFSEKSDLILECPVTKATLPCDDVKCSYNIYLRDDCGIETDAILLTVKGKTSSSSDDDNNTNYSHSSSLSLKKYLFGFLLLILV